MEAGSRMGYVIGIPLREKNSSSPLLSRENIKDLKDEAKRAGYSLRVYISIILRKYAIQEPQGSII